MGQQPWWQALCRAFEVKLVYGLLLKNDLPKYYILIE